MYALCCWLPNTNVGLHRLVACLVLRPLCPVHPPTDDELEDQEAEERTFAASLVEKGKKTARATSRVGGMRSPCRIGIHLMRCVNHVDIVRCFTHKTTTKRAHFQVVIVKEAVETVEVHSKAIVAATAVRCRQRNTENLRAWNNKHPEDTRLVYDSRSRVRMNAQLTTIKNLLTTTISLF